MNEIEKSNEREHLKPRDVMIGAAHAAQLSGVGGPAAHAAVQVVGAVDAAKLAKDAAEGKDVRALDAAAAAASVTMASDLGGPAAQTAAKAVAAVSALDASERAINTVNDIEKPDLIDDEMREKRHQDSRREEANDDRADRQDSSSSDRTSEDDAKFVTPDALRKRYLQSENKFYFRDEENKLAFEDKGKRLATEHNDPDVAKSMIELAEAKGWKSIKVKGTDEFKREVWLQASLKGMEVSGFKPRDVDLAKLEDLRKEAGRKADKALNSIEQTPERVRTSQREEPAERSAVVDEQQRSLSDQQRQAVQAIKAVMRNRGDSEKAVEMAAAIAAERFQTNRVYVGKVLEHGAAPYEDNPKNEASYYVKLQTESGERKVWGVDLSRAMEEGKVNVGDEVALAYQGSQQVTVKVRERDESGNVIGESEIPTKRNTWDIRKLDQVREEVKQQIAERGGERQPIVKVFDRDAPRTDTREVPSRETVRENERARG